MRGSKTPAATVRKFRRKYLELGNASAAARYCGIPIDTGVTLAKEANADTEFRKVHEELDARALEGVESIMLAGIARAGELMMSGPKTVEGIAKLMEAHQLRSFQDPRPNYLAQIVNAHKSLTSKQKDQQAPSQPIVVIDRYAPPGADGSGSTGPGDPPDSAEPATGGLPVGGGAE